MGSGMRGKNITKAQGPTHHAGPGSGRGCRASGQGSRVGETNVAEGILCALPPGGSARVSPLGCQPELDTVIAALASALSRARGPPAGTSRKVRGPRQQPGCVCRAALRTAWPLGTRQMRAKHTHDTPHSCAFVLTHTGTCAHRYIHHTLIHTPGPHALQVAKQYVRGTSGLFGNPAWHTPTQQGRIRDACPRGSGDIKTSHNPHRVLAVTGSQGPGPRETGIPDSEQRLCPGGGQPRPAHHCALRARN